MIIILKNETKVFQNANEKEITEKLMEFINEVNTKIETDETAYANVSRYDPLVAGTYMPLPKKLQDKKAIINVQTEETTSIRNGHSEQCCFAPKGKNPLRTTSYPTDDEMPVNHLTKWTNGSKTIKKIVRSVSNHCFFPTKCRDAVRDHCHMTRKYRGAAHYTYNLNLRIRPGQNPIPFVFHNFKGYDAHLLFQEKAKIKGKKLMCIPNNMEKYISFSLRVGGGGGGGGGGVTFIYSLNFLQASLDALVKNLPRKALKHTAKHTKKAVKPAWAEGGVSIRIHGWVGVVQRHQTAPQRPVLQLAE